jgi:hypothetical protein
MSDKDKPCKCNCGYTCDGPGRCELNKENFMACIKEHWVKDCEHEWDGPTEYFMRCASVTCSKCGMTAIDHDTVVGP